MRNAGNEKYFSYFNPLNICCLFKNDENMRNEIEKYFLEGRQWQEQKTDQEPQAKGKLKGWCKAVSLSGIKEIISPKTV